MIYNNEVIQETAKAAFSFSKVKKEDVPAGFKSLVSGFEKAIKKEVDDRYKIKDGGNQCRFTVFMPSPFDRITDGRVPKYYRDFTDKLFKAAGLKRSKERINWVDSVVDNCYYYYKKAKTKNKEDCYFIAYLDTTSVGTQRAQSDGISSISGSNVDGTVHQYKCTEKMSTLYFVVKCIRANNKVEKILEGSNWYAL